jgi:hypothetical protein
MNRVQFRKILDDEVRVRGWIKTSCGWIIPSSDQDDNVVAFEVQKSSHGEQYYVGLKVFRDIYKGSSAIRQGFDLRKSTTNLYRRVSRDFDQTLDLSASMDDQQRHREINRLLDFVSDFAEQAKTNKGLIQLGEVLAICQ